MATQSDKDKQEPSPKRSRSTAQKKSTSRSSAQSTAQKKSAPRSSAQSTAQKKSAPRSSARSQKTDIASSGTKKKTTVQKASSASKKNPSTEKKALAEKKARPKKEASNTPTASDTSQSRKKPVRITLPYLRTLYEKEVVPQMRKQFAYTNDLSVPRLLKVVLNIGVGEAINDKNAIDEALKDLVLIAGQRPIVTRVRRSIAGFKIRSGWPIGCKVTLRRSRMYEFIYRLVNVALPRVRDFRGLNPRSFDGQGNFALGIGEQIIFPEIDYDKISKIRGLDIVITTSAHSDEEGLALLKYLKFPFRA